MKKLDLLVYQFSPIIIVIGAVLFNLTLEHLLVHGYSSSSVLIYRGILTMSITILLAQASQKSIFPKKIHLQLVRLTNSGIAMMLTFEAYKGLAASTVAMIGRLDIPLAVIIGYMVGKRKKDFKIGLSVFAICLVLSSVFFAKTIDEKPIALILGLIAVCMTSISYLLVKKSTAEENNFSIVNTTNIGCILIGVLSGLIRDNLTWVKPKDLWIFGLASISQFALNYSMSVVYRRHQVERAQRPFLVGALAVLVAEQIIEQKLFAPLHIALILSVISTIYLITLKQAPWKKQLLWIKSRTMGDPEEVELTSVAE